MTTNSGVVPGSTITYTITDNAGGGPRNIFPGSGQSGTNTFSWTHGFPEFLGLGTPQTLTVTFSAPMPVSDIVVGLSSTSWSTNSLTVAGGTATTADLNLTDALLIYQGPSGHGMASWDPSTGTITASQQDQSIIIGSTSNATVTSFTLNAGYSASGGDGYTAFLGFGLSPSLAISINTTGSAMNSSNLGVSLIPDFQGGTLNIVSGATNLSNNFNVENYAGNTIDANGNATVFTGTFTGAGGLAFADSSGNGNVITLSNSGGATYSGTTTVTSATLNAGAANVFSPNSAVVLSNAGTAALNLNGFNQTINGLSGGGGSGGNVALGTATLTNNAGGTYASMIFGAGSYVQAGGTQVFTGNNTYTGGTTRGPYPAAKEPE